MRFLPTSPWVLILLVVLVSIVSANLNHDVESRHRSHMKQVRSHKKWFNKPDKFLVVDTGIGKVRGTFNATFGAYKWLGVPFGESTAGNNRFLPPKPKGKWSGIRDATHYGWSCPQHSVGSAQMAIRIFGVQEDIFDVDTQSEDCLNMDIYAGGKFWERFVTASDEEKRKMRVPIWLNIYGGSFEWGTSRINFYRGDYIVTHDDILVININFRNWIFGFPGTPHLKREHFKGDGEYPGENPGWLDIELAIKWVRKHIEAFGGNPDMITIGGTSSGAALVDNWAYVHHNKDDQHDIAGGIMQSGSMTSLGRYFTVNSSVNLADPYGSWNNVSAKVGCGRHSNEGQFHCMQHKPWQALMNATFNEDKMIAKFGPIADGVTFFDDYFKRLKEGRFARHPLLIGNNKDEGNTLFTKTPVLAPLLGPYVTSEIWVCPSSVQTKIRSNMNAPTYRYRFSPTFYLPQTPDEQHALGTAHGTDTSYSWGTWRDLMYIRDKDFPDYKLAIPTSDFKTRARVAKLYRESMVQFVKDPTHGLQNFDYGYWPQYKPHAKTIGDIGYNNEGKLHIISSDDVDGLCPLTDVETEKVNARYKEHADILLKFIA